MPPNIYRRGSKYIFRRVVPKDIRKQIGRCEIKVSLGGDYARARRLGAELTVETDRQFALERGRHHVDDLTEEQQLAAYLGKPNHQRLNRVTKLTPEFSQGLVAYWLSTLQQDMIQRTSEGISDEEYEALNTSISDVLPLVNNSLATGQYGKWYEQIILLARLRGYDLDLPKPDLRALTVEMLKGYKEYFRVLEERQKGNLIEPAAPGLILKAAWDTRSDHSFHDQWWDIFEHWNLDRVRSKNTVYEARVFWERLVGYCNGRGILPKNIRRSDVTDFFREVKVKRAVKLESIRKMGGLLGAVFSVAVEDEKLKENPFKNYNYQRLQPKVGNADEDDSREPFDQADVRKIFALDGPLYKGSSGGGGVYAQRWIPLLALFSGARLAELCNLTTDCIFAENQHPYFQIRKGKNSNAVRFIPIHLALIGFGFLEFVKSVDGGPLFPVLFDDGKTHSEVARSKSKQSDRFGKWFNRQLRLLGMPGTKVFHSFRHLFKDSCRDAGIEEPLHDALTGHSPRHVGGNYGKGYGLEVMAEAIGKINHIVPAPPPIA